MLLAQAIAGPSVDETSDTPASNPPLSNKVGLPLTGEGQVDLGAQYITATSSYQASHARFYKELTTAVLLQP